MQTTVDTTSILKLHGSAKNRMSCNVEDVTDVMTVQFSSAFIMPEHNGCQISIIFMLATSKQDSAVPSARNEHIDCYNLVRFH